MPRERKKYGKTAVHFFREDGFMVRGVSDPCEAYRMALDECDGEDGQRIGCEAYDAHQERDGEGSWPISAEDIGSLADEVWSTIQNAKVQRTRIVPTGTDSHDGYAWLAWALSPDAKGPGVFTAVMFM